MRAQSAWRAVVVAAALAMSSCAAGGDFDAGEGDAGAFPSSPFAVEVVSLDVGEGGGFNADRAEDVVTGPPMGAGVSSGSLDVVSLGHRGVVVLRLGRDAVDGEGNDLIVFENAFEAGPRTFSEAGEVAVSDDGAEWATFPCAPEDPPPNGCAGMRPVFAHAENAIDPRDVDEAGGDAFDLATIGVSRARFVRVVDQSEAPGDRSLTTGGFDIDAVATVHDP